MAIGEVPTVYIVEGNVYGRLTSRGGGDRTWSCDQSWGISRCLYFHGTSLMPYDGKFQQSANIISYCYPFGRSMKEIYE